MSSIRPPIIAELLGSSGLSDDECKAIHDEAYRLMVDGRSLGLEHFVIIRGHTLEG